MYWNYKTGEFLLDSLFNVATVYEKFGDGLGMFIQCKMLLPILHGLKHKNYSNSIHRFISRVHCEATPKEGLKLIHERFTNRTGKSGGNIFKDRRMEHRIGALKNLINNVGSSYDQAHIQLVNKTIDIKEELYFTTRLSHGVKIRSGNHHARDDTADYKAAIKFLIENCAHKKIENRQFGNYDLSNNLYNYFDRAQFYRWISNRNKEVVDLLEQR